MKTRPIDRFNAAAAAFAAEALDCAAELRLIADAMARTADVAATVGALDFAPAEMVARAESRAAAAPANDRAAAEVERGIAAAFAEEAA